MEGATSTLEAVRSLARSSQQVTVAAKRLSMRACWLYALDGRTGKGT